MSRGSIPFSIPCRDRIEAWLQGFTMSVGPADTVVAGLTAQARAAEVLTRAADTFRI